MADPQPALGPQEDARYLQVLIVDDHPGVRAAIEAMVESWRQVELTSVEDFAAASIWIATLAQLDLLLCDVCLPGGHGGGDVARAALAAHPSVAIVMFSADPRSDIDDLPQRCSFVRKPFGRDALLAQIDDAFVRLAHATSVT